jgi:hypothetical protein
MAGFSLLFRPSYVSLSNPTILLDLDFARLVCISLASPFPIYTSNPMPATPQPQPQTPAPLKQQRSRKAATDNAAAATPGRAGSAGGILLDKTDKTDKKPTMSSSTTKAAGQPKEAAPAAATSTKPRRKPRKLNKEPTPASTPTAAIAIAKAPPDPTLELEALKSRIRSLEAKVEDLYKSTDTRPSPGAARSPRRRGKGRKNSSSNTTATLGTLSREARAPDDDEEEADEELTRLEGELDTARRDLANYRPRSSKRPASSSSNNGPTAAVDDGDFVEEIPRAAAPADGTDRHVTLSGSYRIPLPASVNMDDVKTIQSGVSAAQSVARRVLEQRRAAASSSASVSSSPGVKQSASPASSAVEIAPAGAGGAGAAEKKGWGEWIGGYSMAISRAVKSIEHEAAMEAQRQGAGAGAGAGARAQRKRPGARTALSGEQVQGLMG